mmetsp:Transcript_38316/g.51909  ORF Transcript_38316/g.51909 Transcript_38316/m.51909 type:complete len:103 (-) Transcript_38316:1025-1333(-)
MQYYALSNHLCIRGDQFQSPPVLELYSAQTERILDDTSARIQDHIFARPKPLALEGFLLGGFFGFFFFVAAEFFDLMLCGWIVLSSGGTPNARSFQKASSWR